MSQITDYLASDPYRPAVSLPSLDQYDNYQIYNLFCVDKNVQVSVNGVAGSYSIKMNDWLAVQAYSPFRKIPTDFREIVLAHP